MKGLAKGLRYLTHRLKGQCSGGGGKWGRGWVEVGKRGRIRTSVIVSTIKIKFKKSSPLTKGALTKDSRLLQRSVAKSSRFGYTTS